MAFAALHRLLRPVMRLRERLPAPQSRALRVAFGEEEGHAVEPFLVAVATLSMLGLAAEEGTVLCVVDDAHWLDPASADALLFAARRLGADRVAMVFAARDGERSFRPDGIPQMVLAGLGTETQRRHCSTSAWVRTGPTRSLARLVAETHGNPLALLELPTELSADQIRGTSPLPPHLHLTTRVEQTFVDRCTGLPEDVRLVLLLCAADDTGRSRGGTSGRRPPGRRRAGARGRHTVRAADRRHRERCRCAIPWYGPRSTRPRPASNGVGCTGHWRTPSSGSATRTGRPGTARPPPTARTRRWSRALDLAGARAERRGGYVAACAAYERAAALTTDEALRAG